MSITALLLYPVWRVYYYCKFWALFNIAWKVKRPKAQSQLLASQSHPEMMR